MSELDSLFQEYQPGRIWTYETLVAESDMVCIGTVKSTKKVENAEFFPDFLDRFESEIRVLAVLKGDSKLEDLAFVHFRYRPDTRSTLGNGPTFAVLDDLEGKEGAEGREAGERTKQPATFLLFLHRRPDGAYEPACGNDGAAMGVARVDGFTDDE